jgi:hypothetical protein
VVSSPNRFGISLTAKSFRCIYTGEDTSSDNHFSIVAYCNNIGSYIKKIEGALARLHIVKTLSRFAIRLPA